ncbi:MAG: uracil-DNA glycosylase [Steroidobacteraceae bacterium]
MQTLLLGFCAADTFNPWTQSSDDDVASVNGPLARRQRLQAHLSIRAEQVLIGEASGYQGCRITGIPFTSERLVMAGYIPRLAAPDTRLSTRRIPWSEPSATVVWSTLHELGIAASTVLWNAFPWHPHRVQQPLSNRTPTRSERALGLAVLQMLLAQFPRARVFAVGRHAEQALREIGRNATALRHPSMGGATRFRQALRTAL